MIRTSALALLGAMAFTTAAQVHPSHAPKVWPTQAHAAMAPLVLDATDTWSGRPNETLTVYYTPLKSTEVARYVGFGIAYHMDIVYTDVNGTSVGVSSGPSILSSPQTPKTALTAVVYMANEQPSTYGTLIADPHNGTPFVKGGAGDYYTKDSQGHPYPHTLVARGIDLSARWASIVKTYERVGALGLSYAPMTQNSNSLATTALHEAGIDPGFSSAGFFTPGSFTILP